MRILSVTAQKPNSTGSGVYLTELVKQFHKNGHVQGVIAGIDCKESVVLPEGVGFYPVYFNTETLPFDVVGMSDNMPYPSTRYNQLTETMVRQMEEAFVQVAREAIEEFQPDLIICHHLYLIASTLREEFPNIKMVGICHGTDIRQLIRTDLQRERIKDNIKKMDMIFALHEGQRESIASTYNIDKSRIGILGVGYNNEVFTNRNYEKVESPIKMIFAGKISYSKGVYSMLKALKKVEINKEMEVIFVGGYSDEEEYRKIADISKEVPYKISFLGRVSQEDFVDYFNQCHIMILPSFFEGLPLVIIEALACGLNVIATELPGIKQWLDSNIPDNNIMFVTPPRMKNADEPLEEDLESFETSLAETIENAVEHYQPHTVCTDHALWDVVCKKILESKK